MDYWWQLMALAVTASALLVVDLTLLRPASLRAAGLISLGWAVVGVATDVALLAASLARSGGPHATSQSHLEEAPC